MTRTIMALLIGAAALGSILTSPQGALAGASQNQSVEFRGECRKPNTKGCTANAFPVYQAPTGWFIESASVTPGTAVGHHGIKPQCYMPTLQGHVNWTPTGQTFVVQLPTAFKAHVQVQSGSGPRGIGQVYYVKCRYAFRINRMP